MGRKTSVESYSHPERSPDDSRDGVEGSRDSLGDVLRKFDRNLRDLSTPLRLALTRLRSAQDDEGFLHLQTNRLSISLFITIMKFFHGKFMILCAIAFHGID